MAVNALGERLEQERAKSGLGHTEFARDVLGIDHGQLSRYINDGVVPVRSTMRQIADGLGVPVTDLEALVPERPRRKRDTSPLEQARELIRDVVQETLAQMGHPRAALSIAAAVTAFDDAVEGLPPDEREAILPPHFRDGLHQVRRRILTGERAAPPRRS